MLDKYSKLNTQAQKVKKAILKNNPDIKNLGITLLSLEEFKKINTAEYFTSEEILHSKNRLASLAGRYGVKLAIREAFKKNVPWQDINILSSKSGQPLLTGKFAGSLKAYNLSFSITHEQDLVAAIAVYTGKNCSLAVGIDAAEISRFEQIITNSHVLKKIFTPLEIEQIKNPKDAAGFWSAKEAVSKALGIGIWHGGSLLEIEFANIKNEPRLTLKDNLHQKSRQLGLINWQTNLIVDDEHEISLVLARS